MTPEEFLTAADSDARSLLTAAAPDWSRPVPDCPGWDQAALVRHTGGIFMWMAAIVTSGGPVSRRTLAPPPEDAAELPDWYDQSLAQVLAALRTADADSATWTFSTIGEQRVRWWCRRLAVEVAIHRWDAQHATATGDGGVPGPLAGEVASAGIEEFMAEFLPGLLAGNQGEGLGGTLHLHATDGSGEWWIDLSSARVVPEHAKADSAVRGTRSDLLLWLTNRGPLHSVEVFGDPEIATLWQQLRR